MDKQQIGSLGLSRKSVEQLERVIDTLDTTLYPAHLVIGGWRLFFAACFFAIVIFCQSIYWLCTNIYQNGFSHTAVAIWKMAADFPIAAVLVGLLIIVPIFLVMLPVCRFFTALLALLWDQIFNSPPRIPGRITAAEIISRGYDPNDFDFEKINGVIYGRRRGA
jgi:hypothetical protein